MLRKTCAALIVSALLSLAIVSCGGPNADETPPSGTARLQTTADRPKVIVLLVDSLLSPSIDRLLAANKLPALRFLIENGVYKRDVISSFPTMSVTIDSSLLTGTYADGHGIPGLLWYHAAEKRIVNYGDGSRAVWQNGPRQLLTDSLYNLNQQHLSKRVETLHEALDQAGFTSASINGLIYRGSVPHELVLPANLAKLVLKTQKVSVMGPHLLGFGTLSSVTNQPLPEGPLQSFGFNDAYTAQSLVSLAGGGRLPDVTVAYFPDMDGRLHKNGPGDTSGVENMDRQLQIILNAFGDWRRALEHHVFVVMGDSGVAATAADRTAAVIELDKMMAAAGYRVLPMGRQAGADDDVAIAVNGRMCYVYALSPRAPLSGLAGALGNEPRIDLIAWKEGEWVQVQRGGSGSRLRFRLGGTYRDPYGRTWDVEGDWAVMGLARDAVTGRIHSREYPDGLTRLHGALHSHPGDYLVVTAVPGAEFHANGSPNHPGGGNHGGLHREDSLFPFIAAGKGRLPAPPARIVDVKAYLLSLVQASRVRIGAGR
ncbi:alkaline phosphatase family protein [Brevibacillus thermoruber]|uniref:alkaline phosphatase family protein n=1 Tax=Brevibacillus thermoruber TaxID=33942 RepID=UPI0040419B58